MKLIKKYFVLCILIHAVHFHSYSQNVDSLKHVLTKAIDDTSRLNTLLQLTTQINDDNKWSKYNDEAMQISENLIRNSNNLLAKKGKFGLAQALNNNGIRCYNKGEIAKALIQFKKSLAIHQELGNEEEIAYALNNIGEMYRINGDISKALEYCGYSLKKFEQLNNKDGIALTLSNLGLIYKNQGEIKKALEYYQRSLVIQNDIGDKKGIATSLNNIGFIFIQLKELEKALDYCQKSLRIREEIGDKVGAAYSLNNIAAIYQNKGELIKALDIYKLSLKIRREIDDKRGMAYTLNSIGSIYMDQKKHKLAYLYSDSSLIISNQMGFVENIRNAQELLSKIDSAMSNYNGAFNHYKQYILFRDSISNEDTRKASIKSQLKYEFEKKEAVIKEQQERERAVADEKNRFQKIVIASVIAGLVLVLIFAVFVSRSLKITRKQKLIIEEKQKEILDSIHYAKRIQTALMTNEKYIDKIISRLQKDNDQ